MLNNLIYIGLGGMFGSITRYLTFLFFDSAYHTSKFPLGVLAVNTIGSFIIGMTLALGTRTGMFARHTILHYAFVTGFLGAFTTFSTFSQDNLTLLLKKNYSFFFLNIFSSVFIGLLAVFLGYTLVTIFVEGK